MRKPQHSAADEQGRKVKREVQKLAGPANGEAAEGLPRRRRKRCRSCCLITPQVSRLSHDLGEDEEDLILKLHALVSDRWSLIAGRIPGRTEDEIRNHWNSYLQQERKLVRAGASMDPNRNFRSGRAGNIATVAPRPGGRRCCSSSSYDGDSDELSDAGSSTQQEDSTASIDVTPPHLNQKHTTSDTSPAPGADHI